MAFSKYNKDRPFLIVTRHFLPSDGENTSIKDWGKTGKKTLQEYITIDNSIKNRYLIDATVIIDILQRKLVKSRFSEEDDVVIKHYLEQYKDNIAKGIQQWMDYNRDKMEDFVSTLEEEMDNMDEGDGDDEEE